ncbi:MAG: TonB-dependent receptor [Gammaproteobacteria bacterium]|nr:TonB-dependent receptor [Gammaproteobacteria bacterium]
MLLRKLIVVSGLILLPVYAAAQELEEIIVTHPLKEGGLAQASTELSGTELENALAASIGETLANEAGIRSASFGTAVGRPVIHGLGSTRVKVTQDGLDTMDVSVTSADHAVTVEPFIAEQISVLKGSSTLLFGSGAIGGVVDVATGRHKTKLPEVHSGRVELRYSDVDEGITTAARLDGPISDELAYHLDAFYRDSDDYQIPGFAESRLFRLAEEVEHHDEEGEHDEHHEEEGEEEEQFGVLEGSRNQSSGAALGVSWLGERHHASVAFSGLQGEYGLVGGHGHAEEGDEEHDEEEHAEELAEEGVGIIDMQQFRVDIRAGYQLSNALFEEIDFLLAINDYEHQEVEPDGAVGTDFDNQAWEARLQLHHASLVSFEGLAGIQLNDRQFSALGEEAFIAPTDVRSAAAFWLGQSDTRLGQIELGVRLEDTDTNPVSDAAQQSRSFTTVSASAGLIVDVNEAFRVSGLLDHSSRAPAIEELYSNGPHLATQTFDIGDASLKEESANNISLSFGFDNQRLRAGLTLYYSDFDDFIYAAASGDQDDGLPVFIYRQDDARFKGIDFEVDVVLAELAGGELEAGLTFDIVDAELTGVSGNTNLPRIPADRVGINLAWANQDWSISTRYTQVSSQSGVADFELPSDSYDDVSLRIQRNVELASGELLLFAHAKNLTDDEQRHHVLFVKDVAPAPGRSFELGIRYAF